MGLFDRLNKTVGLYGDANSDYVPCGETCKKCGDGECSKSLGHAAKIAGHQSSSGEKNCGHSWPA